MIKKFSLIFISTVLCTVPFLTLAQGAGIIPSCGYGDPSTGTFVECGFGDLMKLFYNAINYLVIISFPLATLTFAYAGFKMMTARDNAGQRNEAKSMLVKVAIGFFVLLAAWVIVRTVLQVFVNPDIIKTIPLNGVQ